MSISSNVTNHVVFSGDQLTELIWNSGELTDSPGTQELKTLAIGDNTITVPSIDDFTVHGVAFVMPAANTVEPILKGAGADTGITISARNVSVVNFGDTPPASFILEVDAELVGIRLVWF